MTNPMNKPMDNDNLQEKTNDDTMQNEAAAGVSAPEDTAANDWESIVKEQSETINTLLEQHKILTSQINELIRGGAQLRDGSVSDDVPEEPEVNPLFEKYPKFSDIGKDFGNYDKI